MERIRIALVQIESTPKDKSAHPGKIRALAAEAARVGAFPR